MFDLTPNPNASSRVRAYVRKNPSKVNEWLTTALKHFLKNKIAEDAGGLDDCLEDLDMHHFVRHKGSWNICSDVLREHFYLGSQHRVKYSTCFKIREDKASELLEQVTPVEPEFKLITSDKTRVNDLYRLVDSFNISEQLYIHNNLDNYDVRKVRIKQRYSYSEGLGILPKQDISDAERTVFQNAVEKHYQEHLEWLAPLLHKEALKGLVRPEDWAADIRSNEKELSYHEFQVIHELIPNSFDLMLEEDLERCIRRAERFLDMVKASIAGVKTLLEEIKARGSSDAFRDDLRKILVEDFYKQIPLLVNTKDDDLKETVKLAMRSDFRK